MNLAFLLDTDVLSETSKPNPHSKVVEFIRSAPNIYLPADLAPKFYPVLSSLQRFWVAVFGAVAAGCGAEPFRLRSTASRRGLII